MGCGAAFSGRMSVARPARKGRGPQCSYGPAHALITRPAPRMKRGSRTNMKPVGPIGSRSRGNGRTKQPDRSIMKLTPIPAIAAFLLALVLPASALDKTELNSRFQNYFKSGKAVVEMAIAKKVDAAEVAKRVDQMLTEAAWLAQEYAKVHTKGEK